MEVNCQKISHCLYFTRNRRLGQLISSRHSLSVSLSVSLCLCLCLSLNFQSLHQFEFKVLLLSRAQTLASRVQHPLSRVQRPGSSVQSSASSIQSSTSIVQHPAPPSRVQELAYAITGDENATFLASYLWKLIKDLQLKFWKMEFLHVFWSEHKLWNWNHIELFSATDQLWKDVQYVWFTIFLSFWEWSFKIKTWKWKFMNTVNPNTSFRLNSSWTTKCSWNYWKYPNCFKSFSYRIVEDQFYASMKRCG